MLILLVALASTQPAVAKEKQKEIYLLCEYSTMTDQDGRPVPSSSRETLKVSVRDGWKITDSEYFLSEESLQPNKNGQTKLIRSWRIDRMSGGITSTLQYPEREDSNQVTYFSGECKKADKPKL